MSNLAKAQAVTLPVLFFLFDYYKGRKLNIRLILEKIPFLVLGIFFGILAVKAQIVAKAISEQYPLSLSSALNACYGLMTYLFKLIVPVHLAALHPYVYKDISSFPWYFFILPLIFAVLVCLAFRSARQTKDWLFGFMFYLITVSVMIKLVPVSDSMLNERYTYIPYIGLFFIAGQLYSGFSQRQKWKGLASAAMIGILVALSLLTIQRSRTWKDNLTFWKDEIVKYPGYWRGYSSVGWHYYKSGDYDNALDYANRSCEIGVSALPYMLRGAIYLAKMKYPLAIEDFKKVISIHEPSSPLDLDVRYNLGISYDHNGNYLEAINILDESIRMAPDNPKGHVLKGMTLTHMKQYSGAETEYTKAIQISPADVDTYMYRGLLYEDNLNRYDQAIGDFRKVLEIEPDRKDAKINIGISLYKKQAFAEAVQQYDLVLGLFPDDAEVYYLRALAYRGKGSLAEAYGDGLKARQLGYNLSDRDLESLKIKK